MTSVRSLQNPNMATRQVAFYSGVTNGSGVVEFVFSPAFPVPPLVFPSIIGGNPRESAVADVTAFGVTVSVTRPAVDVLLGLTLTLGEVDNPVTDRRVDIAVIGN